MFNFNLSGRFLSKSNTYNTPAKNEIEEAHDEFLRLLDQLEVYHLTFQTYFCSLKLEYPQAICLNCKSQSDTRNFQLVKQQLGKTPIIAEYLV